MNSTGRSLHGNHHPSQGSQRAAHKIPHCLLQPCFRARPRAASSRMQLEALAKQRISLSMCVWSQACMAGVRGILRQRQETRRVGPWMCAPSLPCMCTRRLLGLVDRSRTGSDPSCWGWGWGSPLLAARHMAPSATVPLGHAH